MGDRGIELNLAEWVTAPLGLTQPLKELLAQLQAAIEAETNLPDEDKVEALEQVKTLAEAGQKPEDNILQKSAKTAMKILKGTVSSLLGYVKTGRDMCQAATDY